MKKKTTRATNVAKTLPKHDPKLTFLEHFHELKRRLTYVAVSVAAFGTGAYFIQHSIVGLLLAPSEGQEMIYTTPGGGLDFLFRVCIYTGLIFSFPVIIYQFLKYLEPLLGPGHVRFALKGSAVSALLAAAGITFGYFAGMPAALHFLFHQFTTSQITPMITIQSYMHFVSIYMFGAALLFQVPLVMICINRIKPLSPKTLFKHERWMILFAFVLAVIMNPTPNVVDQIMLAGPMIIMYQVGIGIIAFLNRGKRGPRRSKAINRLLEQDAALRAERESRLVSARQVWQQADAIAERPQETFDNLVNDNFDDSSILASSPTIQNADVTAQTAVAVKVLTQPTPRPVPVTVASPQQAAAAAHRPAFAGRPSPCRTIDGFRPAQRPSRPNY